MFIGKGNSSAQQGFTLIELLIVVGIVVLLAGILVPVVQTARQSARTTQCLAHLHSLGVAWMTYSADNSGLLAYADTSAIGWANSGNTNAQYATGCLGKYLTDPNVYNCPNADNEVNTRSYSVNEIFGSDAHIVLGISPIRFLRQIKDPTKCFVFIEEYDPRIGYNKMGFCLQKSGTQFTDIPAHRHGGHLGGTWDSQGNACCMNFADGRAECWTFTDPRTLSISTYNFDAPNDADLIRLQSVVGY